MTQFWRGMEDVHFKFPKHFLLERCVHQSYQMLRLGYLYSVFIYMYIRMYVYKDLCLYIYTHIQIHQIHILYIHMQMYTYIQVSMHVDDRYIDMQLGRQRYVGSFIINTQTHTHTYIYRYIISHGQEQARKDRGKEVQSDGCKVAQPKRVRLGHFVFGKQGTRSVMLTLICWDVREKVVERLWRMRARRS